MPQLTQTVMQKLYGANIWDGFKPRPDDLELQGWNGNHPSLARLVSLPGPKLVIDIGVWKGQSTTHMARAMQANEIDGVILAVDTFLGSPEHWTMEKTHFKRTNGFPDLYATFMNNVAVSGLCDYVIPMAQTSTTAATLLKRFGLQASIVHVDAAHEYRESLHDMEDYWPLLQEGGFMIGDDYHITWPGVVQAAGEFSARVRKPLVVEPPKFILQK